MSVSAVAGLPMYDYPELAVAHDALWTALAARLQRDGITHTPRKLSRDLESRALWAHPDLLLGQGCEYPLAGSYADTVQLVATPRYSAEGCAAATYCSAIVVRLDDPALRLEDLRQRRCVINERDSNSGMNLLRAAIAPLAGGTPFFSSVTASGSHRNSVAWVSRSEADVAAIDCVSFAHFKRWYPSAVAGLRVLAWTPSSPCLPYITSRATDAGTLDALRGSLADVLADRSLSGILDTLLLKGAELKPREDYAAVLGLERYARDLGYPDLA